MTMSKDKYKHDLPRDATGYELAACTPFDGASTDPGGHAYGLYFRQTCACASPAFDRLTRGAVKISEFCCTCGLPSETALAQINEQISHNGLAFECPPGYAVEVSSGGRRARITTPDGHSFTHLFGDYVRDGHHHACAFADHVMHMGILEGTTYDVDKAHVEAFPIRADAQTMVEAFRLAADQHDETRGRVTVHVADPDQSVWTRAVTITMDGMGPYFTRIPDRKYNEMRWAIATEVRLLAESVARREAPEPCPACDGLLSLCSECGGKGWLPHHRASAVWVAKMTGKGDA